MILEQFLNKKAKEIDNPIRNWGVGYTAEVINEWINLQIQVKKLTIPAVMHRFIPQPIEIEKLMKEKLEHRMINDDLGWTGEWRMSAKDVLDVIIDLQNGV